MRQNAPDNSVSTSVLVVIVNWNSGPHLARCLDCLAAQSYRDFRVLIVDNASTDGSLERAVGPHADAEVLKPGRNLGFAAGNNIAVASRGDAEWIALLNPDAFPAPDWLENLVAAACLHPGYSLLASRMLSASDPMRLDGAGDAYHVSGLAWRRGHENRMGSHYAYYRETFSACAAAALVQTDAFRAAGGFDEDFFCYMEDVDLGFRLRLLGHKCLYAPAAVVHHVGSGSTGAGSDFSVYQGHRNLVWTFVKNMPGWLFWACLPLHLALNLLEIVWFTLQGRPRIILKAKADALRGLPKMLRKRRQIQTHRSVKPSAILPHLEWTWRRH